MNYSGDGVNEVLAAVTTVLAGDFQLRQLGAVYGGQAPPKSDPPYVVIGEALSIRRDILTRKGRIVTISLHVHDKVISTNTTARISGRIFSLLEHPGPTSGSGRRQDNPLPLPHPFSHIATRFLATQRMDVSLAVAHTIIQFEVEIGIHTR